MCQITTYPSQKNLNLPLGTVHWMKLNVSFCQKVQFLIRIMIRQIYLSQIEFSIKKLPLVSSNVSFYYFCHFRFGFLLLVSVFTLRLENQMTKKGFFCEPKMYFCTLCTLVGANVFLAHH